MVTATNSIDYVAENHSDASGRWSIQSTAEERGGGGGRAASRDGSRNGTEPFAGGVYS